ncbi:hypothetical protein ACOMHN_013031 [Nucella lapillus]
MAGAEVMGWSGTSASRQPLRPNSTVARSVRHVPISVATSGGRVVYTALMPKLFWGEQLHTSLSQLIFGPVFRGKSLEVGGKALRLLERKEETEERKGRARK